MKRDLKTLLKDQKGQISLIEFAPFLALLFGGFMMGYAARGLMNRKK